MPACTLDRMTSTDTSSPDAFRGTCRYCAEPIHRVYRDGYGPAWLADSSRKQSCETVPPIMAYRPVHAPTDQPTNQE